MAGVAQAHTHAFLGIFDRSSMAAMIADSTASVRYHGKPNAEYALAHAGLAASAAKCITSISAFFFL
jgi:hypothetical protein